MGFIPAAIFNIIEGDANYRKIIAQIESDPIPGVGTTYNVYYRVDGPVAALRVPNFTIPDGTMTNVAPIAVMPLVGLPLDSAGSTLEGNYKLTYYVEDAALPGTYTEVVSSIVLDVLKEGPESCRIQARIGIDVNCVCYRITVTDNTVYGNANEVTVTSRTMTIIPPTIPGGVAPAPIVTTDPSITIGFDYANVTYIVNLLANYQHENTDGTIVVMENLVAQVSQRVVCDFNLCKLIKCINETIGKLERKAAQVGGWPNLTLVERDTLTQLYTLWMLMEMYRTCGNYNEVYKVYNRIVALIGCDCGCTEANTDHPIAVSATCGGASGNITTINGTSPVMANIAGTTVTISLDPNFINAALAVLTTLNLTAPIQGSVSLDGKTLSLNLNPLQYVKTISIALASAPYLSVTANTPTAGNHQLAFNPDPIKFGTWTTLNNTYSASRAAVMNYSGITTPTPIRYSINEITGQIRFDGRFFAIDFSGGPNYLTFDISLSLPASTRRETPMAAFNLSGDCVGYVILVGVGPTNFNLYFRPNANLVTPCDVLINGIINFDA